MNTRPVASFAAAAATIAPSPAAPAGTPPGGFTGTSGNGGVPTALIPSVEEIGSSVGSDYSAESSFSLASAPLPPVAQRFPFGSGSRFGPGAARPHDSATPNWAEDFSRTSEVPASLPRPEQIADLKPLGQVNASFIVAVSGEGLWLVDQHVAHERVRFEQHLEARRAGKVEGQRLLMPMVIELAPRQLVIYEKIGEELAANGFEVEPMGPKSVAIQAVPAGVAASDAEHLLREIMEGLDPENAAISTDALRAKIAASTACHAAIKVNMPLEQTKMEWLLAALAKTDCPMSCTHGRPVVLRYSVREIEKAFHRI